MLLEEGLHAKSPHQHYALQLSVALDHAVWGAFEGEPREVPFAGALVAPNRRHAVRGRVLNVFFEPHSARGRMLWQLVRPAGHRLLEPAVVAACRRLPGFEYFLELAATGSRLVDLSRCERSAAEVVEMLCSEVSPAAPPALDDRIGEVRGILRRAPGSRIRLDALAEHVQLSPSRLRHLFAEQMGVSIRSYVVWLRTITAIEPLVRGADVATAAHRAGFADQAAFARSYRRTWGVTPSAYTRIVQFPDLDYMKTHAGPPEPSSWLETDV